MRLRDLAWLVVAVVAGGLPVRGNAAGSPPVGGLVTLSDQELAARLDFLLRRLSAEQPPALVWQWGWTSLFGVRAARHAVAATTARTGDERVMRIVEATRSAGEVALMLIDPLPSRLGAGPMLAVPAEDRAGRLQRLAVGERQLVENADRAETRYSLRRHLTGVALGLLGGSVIAAFGDESDALRSVVVAIALDEARIWSQPWIASADLRDYKTAFPGAMPGQGISWELRPMGTGLQLAFRF